MARRTELKNDNGATNYSSKYALSGITYCGKCGQIYRRLHWNNRGKKSIVWRCLSRLDKHKDCDARTIDETDLKQTVVEGMNQVFGNHDEVRSILASALQKVIGENGNEEISAINLRLQELQVQLLSASSKNHVVTEIGEQIIGLKEEKEKLLLKQGTLDNSRQRIDEMIQFLDEMDTGIKDFDEVLVRRMIEEVKIFDEHIAVKFKSEIEAEIRD